MSLTMTSEEYYEAYPNGMDEDDLEAWNHAVEKNCYHDDAERVMDTLHADSVHCPNCGVVVTRDQIEAAYDGYDEIAAQERAVGA